jgi:selenocysteine lyase/cysteine desulfurase
LNFWSWSPGRNLPALHARLSQSKIITSLRQSHDGRKHLRMSLHFYNTDGEVERLLELL